VLAWDVRIGATLLLGACAFHPGSIGGDGGVADAPNGPDGPKVTCLERWAAHAIAFDAGTALANVNETGAEDRDPFLSDDELTLYFDSDRSGTTLSYTASRGSIGGAFSTPMTLPGAIDGMGEVSKLATTKDGLDAVLSSKRPGSMGSSFDLWEAKRNMTSMAFGAPNETDLMMEETSDDEFDPWLSPAGLHLYFAPESTALGHQTLAFATRNSLGTAFGAPTVLTELDNAAGEGDPALTYDELVIVYTSSQTGSVGGTDLWYATRVSAIEPFGTPALVPGINTTANEGDAHLSPDGCRLYFATDGAGDYDLYVATMQ